MKTIALCTFVYLVTCVFHFWNMFFIRKWWKQFDSHHAWKEEKLEKNLQCLDKYANHHIIDLVILSIGMLSIGIAVWLAHSMSEWTLFIITSILFIWNILGVILVISSLRNVRKIRNWMKEGQEVELKIGKWFDDLKLLFEKFRYQLEHRLH